MKRNAGNVGVELVPDIKVSVVIYATDGFILNVHNSVRMNLKTMF